MSLIPNQIKGFITELSDLLSADDTDFQTPPVVAPLVLHEGSTDPLAGKPAYMSLDAEPVKQTMLPGVLASVQSSLSSAASSVSSGISSLVSKVSGSTSSDPATKSASSAGSSSSSWMLWALLAGGAAAVYFAVKGKGKKSIFGKLGGKSSIKL